MANSIGYTQILQAIENSFVKQVGLAADANELWQLTFLWFQSAFVIYRDSISISFKPREHPILPNGVGRVSLILFNDTQWCAPILIEFSGSFQILIKLAP